MDRPTFVQLAQRWLTEGKAKCTPWKGTITQTSTKTIRTPLSEDVSDTTVTITLKDNGDRIAHVHLTGHVYQTGQGCFSARDTYAVDADATPEVNILVSRDLQPIPGFTPAAPNLPAAVSLPPNVPAPPNLLGGDTYTIVFLVPPVTGSDHQEQRNEPGCGLTTTDHSFTFTPAGLTLAKRLDPKQPDHLKDSDTTTTQGPSTITTQWDLTRD